VRRREFIALLGGAAAVVWPLAARAQQPALPVIGFLRVTSASDSTHLVAAFQQGLKQTGFVLQSGPASANRMQLDLLRRRDGLSHCR